MNAAKKIGSKRNFSNPYPRLALAVVLTIWAGSNLCFVLFRYSEIWSTDISSRSMGLILSIMFTQLPFVVAIYLIWTLVVGPEDEQQKSQKKVSRKKESRQIRRRKNKRQDQL